MQKQKRSILEPGDTILNGKYEIISIIHSSGMANVYLVKDNNLSKHWCLKEIKKSEAGKNKVEYYSLLQEANIMKSLNHSSIPRIVTIEQDGDSIFIIMDYVDGISLKTWLVKKKTIKQEVAVTWMRQICQVMIYLHNRKQPIFYRDMKPDNIMIQGDGNIKLLDFGISVVIKEPGQKIERALGTKGYAAPEQRKAGNVCDLRSDIYAMGKTLYFMLTLLNPSTIPQEKLKPVREINPSVSVGLERIVEKCIQEDPDNRYQTCEELLYDLSIYTDLDYKHKRQIRNKVTLVFAMFLTSIFILTTSLIPLNMHKAQKADEYNSLVSVANQSGKAEDFARVLDANPIPLEPYYGYIDSMKIDGVFTKEEESSLLNYINPNLDTLKQQKEYGKLAYSIGKLYWFYYEGNTDDEGMITSVKWFSDAIEAGYEKDLANVYYQLGMFKKNLSVSVTESNDSGLYRKYWNNLIQAKSADNGELVDLQLNLALANCISTYSYNLKQDEVSYEEITSQVKELEQYVNTYTPSIEKAKSSYELLQQTVATLSGKVESIYKGGAM